MFIYIARFEYGKGNLSKAEVIKETEKTYFVTDEEDILGWVYVSGRVRKDDNIFLNIDAAVYYLIEKASEYIVACEVNIDKAKAQICVFSNLLDR